LANTETFFATMLVSIAVGESIRSGEPIAIGELNALDAG
jgi:hypothetical protein